VNPHKKPLQQELGELKEIIGKLWKSVDAFKLTTAETDHKTQEHITTWTQVNLQLLQLLSAKTAETERLAQNSIRLTTTLTKLDEHLQDLEQQIAGLNKALLRSQTDTQSGSVNQELAALSLAVSRLSDQIEPLLSRSGIVSHRELSWTEAANISLAISASLIIVILGVSLKFHTESVQAQLQSLQEQSTEIQKRVSWGITKLERLEKRP
jgi:small-conductance mechanosensitive channel